MDATKARTRTFDPQRFLNSTGATRKIVTYRRSAIIFAQGDPCARNIRIEEDLVDHLFNSSEKRLARTLLRNSF